MSFPSSPATALQVRRDQTSDRRSSSCIALLPSLMPYEDCDTFISHDAGVSWHMAFEDASKYEFGDQGSIIVAVNDEASTSTIKYSWDAGKTWCVLPKVENDLA